MSDSRDDFELESEYDFSKGIRGRFYHPRKESTTIRLDEDVILFFKKRASERKVEYQSLVNAALRDYVRDHGVE